MPFPRGPVQLESVHGISQMKVVREFCWRGYVTDKVQTICVPKDTITDGASIPRVFRRLIGGKFARYRDAAVVHDWLYATPGHGYTRLEADQVFLNIMRELGIKRWRRRLMYRAVRMGGWRYWRRTHGKASA